MYKVNEILKTLNGAEYHGADDVSITKLIEIDYNNTDTGALFWANDANLHKAAEIKAGTLICSKKIFEFKQKPLCNVIITAKPREAFKIVLEKLFYKAKHEAFIAGSAIIDNNVVMGKNNFIGQNVVIESGCEIGDNVFIGHNTIIHSKTIIANNVKIGCNNTIGGNGFGYVRNDKGEFEFLPHIGGVKIHENVEIGNNTCIDKGVLGNTELFRNVKVDNLVHIAHNVKIEENSLIIANAMIGGSTVIGAGSWVGPSVSILNKVDIGKDCFLGMGTVVIRKTEESSVIVGNPGKFLRKSNH